MPARHRRRVSVAGLEVQSGMPCVFCDWLACADARSRVMASSKLCVAYLDAFPLNPGHTLIIPRRHEADLRDLTAEEHAALFELVPSVMDAISSRFGQPDGFNVGLNCGAAAGQTVPHVHLHVIPRLTGDVRYGQDADPRGGVRWVIPQRAAYWKQLPA